MEARNPDPAAPTPLTTVAARISQLTHDTDALLAAVAGMKFQKGFTNAIRRPVYMSDLL